MKNCLKFAFEEGEVTSDVFFNTYLDFHLALEQDVALTSKCCTKYLTKLNRNLQITNLKLINNIFILWILQSNLDF